MMLEETKNMLNMGILVYHCSTQNKQAVFKGHHAIVMDGVMHFTPKTGVAICLLM